MYKQELFQRDSPYLLSRQELSLPSRQTVMTEVSVAVTRRDAPALINPPLLSSVLLIQSQVHSVFFSPSSILTNGLSNPQRLRERLENSQKRRNKTMSGSAVDEPLRAAGKIGPQSDGGKERYQEEETGTRKKKKTTHFTV